MTSLSLALRGELLLRLLMNRPRLPVHIIHQQILAQILRRGEIRLQLFEPGRPVPERLIDGTLWRLHEGLAGKRGRAKPANL